MAQDEDEFTVDSLGLSTGLGIPDLEESVARRGVRQVVDNAGNAHKMKVSGGRRGIQTVLHISTAGLFDG